MITKFCATADQGPVIVSSDAWGLGRDSHEYYDGHSLWRYVNQTDYEHLRPYFPKAEHSHSERQAAAAATHGVSTATSALGHLLVCYNAHLHSDVLRRFRCPRQTPR